MRTATLRQSGGSVIVSLPKAFLDQLGLKADTPVDIEVIDDPRAADVSQDRGGGGNGHDVVHLPTPVDKSGADKNGTDKMGADKPAAGTAAPGTPRPRLFERISSLSKV